MIGILSLVLLTHCLRPKTAYSDGAAATISLAEKEITLADLVQKISSSTGQVYKVDPTIAGSKLTVFCHEVSAEKLIGQLEETLFLTETSDGKKIKLKLMPKVAPEEAGMRLHETVAIQNVLLRKVSAWSKQAETERGIVEAELAELERKFSSRPFDVPSARLRLLRERAFFPFGRALEEDANNGVQSLLTSRALIATTYNLPNVYHLPQSCTPSYTVAVPASASNQELTYQRAPTGVVGVIRFSSSSLQLEAKYYLGGMGEAGVLSSYGLLDLAPELQTASGALGKRLSNWAQVESASVIDERLQKGPTLVVSNGQGRPSLADQLENFYKRSGIPFIADSFHIADPSSRVLIADTARGWMKAFSNRTDPAHAGFLRFSNGFLMVRHAGYWRLENLEPSESSLRVMENHKELTCSTYASFVSSLSPAQLAFIADRDDFVCNFPVQPIRIADAQLALWGSLTGDQRAAALSDDGLSQDSLTLTQKELFVIALSKLLWQRPLPERYLRSLLPGSEDRLAGVRLFASQRMAREGEWTRNEVSAFPGSHPPRVNPKAAFEFLFGDSRQWSVGQTIYFGSK